MAQLPSRDGIRAPIPTEWYDLAFGEHYSRIYRRRDAAEAAAEVAFAIKVLALEPNHRVLDLCSGGGRHLRELTEAGLSAIGLDRSGALLQEARRSLGPAQRLVRGDMRHLPFPGGRFDAVVNFFSSFGYFFDDGENQQVLEEIARVLVVGGVTLIDLMDRRTVMETLVPESERREDDRVIHERRRISADGTRVEKEIVLETTGAEPRCFHESVRMYTLEEVRAALASAGLETESVCGSFEGILYEAGATPRMILVARRKTS